MIGIESTNRLLDSIEVDEAGQNPVNVNLEDSSGSSEVLIEAGQGAIPTVRLESNQVQSNSNGLKKPLIIWCLQTIPPCTKGKINLDFSSSIYDLPAALFEPWRSTYNANVKNNINIKLMRVQRSAKGQKKLFPKKDEILLQVSIPIKSFRKRSLN